MHTQLNKLEKKEIYQARDIRGELIKASWEELDITLFSSK